MEWQQKLDFVRVKIAHYTVFGWVKVIEARYISARDFYLKKVSIFGTFLGKYAPRKNILRRA